MSPIPQARRVPWTRLAEASDHYTEWHVFSLWMRAVVDAAHTVPEIVKSDVKSRAPHLLEAYQCNSADVEQTTSPGTRLWQQVSGWTDDRVFASAKAEDWLDAVHYFSCISIRSMKAWAHWEKTDDIWRASSPTVFPSCDEWRAVVESVNKLANPTSVGQQVLDAMNQVTAQARGPTSGSSSKRSSRGTEDSTLWIAFQIHRQMSALSASGF